MRCSPRRNDDSSAEWPYSPVGFDLAAIKEVCGSESQTAAKVADLTARLVERSLLFKEGDSARYQPLETIRQYAAEQLVVVGELDATREHHARYYLGVALRESAATLTGPERTHLEVLRRIEDNTRIALECLLEIDPQAALTLAASLNIFCWTQGKLREGIGWLERAREAAADGSAASNWPLGSPTRALSASEHKAHSSPSIVPARDQARKVQ